MSKKNEKGIDWKAVLAAIALAGVFIWLIYLTVQTQSRTGPTTAMVGEVEATEVTEAQPIPTTAPAAKETTPDMSSETHPTEQLCRPNIWFDEAFHDTRDVASLISVLDRDFTLDDGGQWSEPGYTVPEVAVFWTDLFDNRSSLPAGVSAIRTQGGWGVYYTSDDYVVPPPNGGGRWMKLCDALQVPKAAVEVAPVVEVAPTEPVAVGCVLPNLTGKTVAQAINAMDQWFEDTAYQWGSGFAVGDKLPAGSVFWTNMGEGFERPECLKELVAEGNWGVFSTSQKFTAPSAGRYVVCNS